jgi:TolC family type I secretion outer membrane protein
MIRRFAFAFLLVAGIARAQTNELTLPQCLDLALKQNPAILKAQQEIRRTHGLIVEARAQILPHLTATGEYTQLDPGGIDKFPFSTNGVPTVFKNQEHPWNAQIEATQIIYAGGRVAAGIRAAKLGDQYAVLGFQRTVADTVLDVRKTFYSLLLAQQQVIVREQSVKLLAQQLEDARHRFDAGDVPKFNVLRAEVELANAKPPLIRAQNSVRLTREVLVKLLAIDTPQDFTPVTFTGQLTYQPRHWELPAALQDALAKRPELRQAEKLVGSSAEEIKIAQAGYKPEVSIFGGYQIYDSSFGHELDNTVNGWRAGARASWPIFDGMLARGQVTQARAKRAQAELDLADARRGIELEVRQAYSDYLQALELFEAQKKTVEQAEESLRLAEARFRAGTGTQLDVLSAQTALTEARSNEIQSLYDYNVAVATLDRATGATVKAE